MWRKLPWWCGKFWLAGGRWKPGTISSSGRREEVRSMLSCLKKERGKKGFIFCANTSAFQKPRDGGAGTSRESVWGKKVAERREKEADSASCSRGRLSFKSGDFWPLVAPAWPFRDLTHLKLTAGPALKTRVSLCVSLFFAEQPIYQLSTVIQSRVWRAVRRCQVSRTSTILTQPRGREECRGASDRQIWTQQFSIFSFSQKKRNAEAPLPGTALGPGGGGGEGGRTGRGYGSCRTCARASQLSPHGASKNIHKCPEKDLELWEGAAKSFPSKDSWLQGSCALTKKVSKLQPGQDSRWMCEVQTQGWDGLLNLILNFEGVLSSLITRLLWICTCVACNKQQCRQQD